MSELNLVIVNDNDDCCEYCCPSWFYPDHIVIGNGDVGKFYDLGIRFRNVVIPQGEIINQAVLRLKFYYANEGLSQEFKKEIFGVALDDTEEWSSENKPSDQPITTAKVTGFDFSFNSQGKTFYGEQNLDIDPVVEVDITNIIQEIINREGWVSGNNLSLVTRAADPPGDTYNSFYWFDYTDNPEFAASLIIDYGKEVLYLSPDPSKPTGYHCFMSQFVKNCLRGYIPLKTPDGVNRCW